MQSKNLHTAEAGAGDFQPYDTPDAERLSIANFSSIFEPIYAFVDNPDISGKAALTRPYFIFPFRIAKSERN